jgi:hypothetical protein
MSYSKRTEKWCKATVWLHPDQLRELRRDARENHNVRGYAHLVRAALDRYLYPSGVPGYICEERQALRDGKAVKDLGE